MLENDEHKKIEVLLAEVKVHAGTLFGSLSNGISHKTKLADDSIHLHRSKVADVKNKNSQQCY